MASISQGVPIRAYWDLRTKARCQKKHAFFLDQSIRKIALEFVVLILPLHPLWKFNMKRFSQDDSCGCFRARLFVGSPS